MALIIVFVNFAWIVFSNVKLRRFLTIPVYELMPYKKIRIDLHHTLGTFLYSVALLKFTTRFLAMSALQRLHTLKSEGPEILSGPQIFCLIDFFNCVLIFGQEHILMNFFFVQIILTIHY
jgi:hypothetical protein